MKKIAVAIAVVLLLVAGAAFISAFRQAQIRAFLSKTGLKDVRGLAVALESYYIDHKAYPPAVDLDGGIVAYDAGVSAGYVPWLLTTPIAYADALPADPYHDLPTGGNGPYHYATNGTGCWIVVSNGPDRKPDIQAGNYPSQKKAACEWKRFASQFGIGTAIEYDATNGTYSSGDIYRVGP